MMSKNYKIINWPLILIYPISYVLGINLVHLEYFIFFKCNLIIVLNRFDSLITVLNETMMQYTRNTRNC
jgi:hypothetical protein